MLAPRLRPQLHRARHHAAERGMSIIESMIAMAVLTVGVLGAFSGIVTASRQSSIAGRIGRAAAIAESVRAGLSIRGAAALVAPGGLLNATNCTTNADVLALTDGLNGVTTYRRLDQVGSPQTITVQACVIDLDALDNPLDANAIVPNYIHEEATAGNPNGIFRRVLVYYPDGNTPPQNLMMTVVVSWQENGRRQFHHQAANLYNANGLQLGVVDL